MGLGLLLIPTLAGYWILTHWIPTRYRVRRYQGYHVVFRSALCGLIPAAIAYILVAIMRYIETPFYVIWERFVPFDYSCMLVTILLGFVFPKIINRRYDQQREALRAAEEEGNRIELLLAESESREMLVEISLRTRKSYIGYVLRNATEDVNGADISIVPLWSGYRKEDTQELKITTDYVSALLGHLEEENDFTDFVNEDFRVVVPMSEVVSARLFRPDLYKMFRDQEEFPLGLRKDSTLGS